MRALSQCVGDALVMETPINNENADAGTKIDIVRVALWRQRQGRGRFVIVALLMFGLTGIYQLMAPYAFLSWNFTTSLDGHLFFVVRRAEVVPVGGFVAFQPPANPYYPKTLWFTKLVIAGEGDVISHKDRALLINNVPVAYARPTDSKGKRELVMTPDGVIPKGYLFAWTPHPFSYDSRYAEIGLVPHEKIIGRAYRLF